MRDGYDLYVSVATLREIRQGDPEAAARRLEFVAWIPVLRLNTEIRRLAGLYRESAGLPEGAGTDMAHVAFASFYETDYLVTWNCTHIANSVVIRRLTELSLKTGHYMPLIVTPEEFLWPQEETQDEA